MKIFTLKTGLLLLVVAMLGACSTNETFVEETTQKKVEFGLVEDSELKTTMVNGTVIEGEFNKQKIIATAYSVHYDYINSRLIIYTSESEFKKHTKSYSGSKAEEALFLKSEAVSATATPAFYDVKHRSLGFFMVQADTGSDHVIGFRSFNNTTDLASGHWVQDGSATLNARTNYTLNTITNHAKNANSIVHFRNCSTSSKYLAFYTGTSFTGAATKYSLPANTHVRITFAIGSAQKSMKASLTTI